MSSDRTRLCLILNLGQSVRIGEDVMTVAVSANRPGFHGRDRYNEAHLWFQSGPRIWFVDGMEAYLPGFSVQVNEIHHSKVRLAIRADPSIKITRLGQESKDEALPS
jgi:hypothetical protein